MMARAWADVDLAAIRANARALRAAAGTQLCAVVKADGYGHGAVPVARAALDGGATWLAVALVPEAALLRAAGIDAPILLLSEPRHDELGDALAAELHLTAYSQAFVESVATLAQRERRRVPIHLKVDTGMHRVGVAPEEALTLAKSIERAPGVDLHAVWTHCAVADEPDDPFTAEQLRRLDGVLAELAASGISPTMRHAANSAATIGHPAARLDLVRCGIAIYGIEPSAAMAGSVELVPALRLWSEVSFVKSVPEGARVSYGLRYRTTRGTVLATVPIGYADGVTRRLPELGQEVLVGGRRCPMAGRVTMDQLVVDVGPGADVATGDEVVLLGAQGGERIRPEEWAGNLDTIGYEVVCGIGPRVERRYVG